MKTKQTKQYNPKTGKKEDVFFIDGREVSKEEYEHRLPDQPLDLRNGAGLIAFRPIKSDSLAVSRRQVPQEMERARRRGLDLQFTEEGQPILDSRQKKKEYCEMRGVFDRDAGYGDAQYGRPDQKPAEEYGKDDLKSLLKLGVTEGRVNDGYQEITNEGDDWAATHKAVATKLKKSRKG